MPTKRPFISPLVLAAWLAIAAQAMLALQAGWHHHETGDPQSDHRHHCAFCAAALNIANPVEPPAPIDAPLVFVSLANTDRQRSPYLSCRQSFCPRGPPSVPICTAA